MDLSKLPKTIDEVIDSIKEKMELCGAPIKDDVPVSDEIKTIADRIEGVINSTFESNEKQEQLIDALRMFNGRKLTHTTIEHIKEATQNDDIELKVSSTSASMLWNGTNQGLRVESSHPCPRCPVIDVDWILKNNEQLLFTSRRNNLRRIALSSRPMIEALARMIHERNRRWQEFKIIEHELNEVSKNPMFSNIVNGIQRALLQH